MKKLVLGFLVLIYSVVLCAQDFQLSEIKEISSRDSGTRDGSDGNYYNFEGTACIQFSFLAEGLASNVSKLQEATTQYLKLPQNPYISLCKSKFGEGSTPISLTIGKCDYIKESFCKNNYCGSNSYSLKCKASLKCSIGAPPTPTPTVMPKKGTNSLR